MQRGQPFKLTFAIPLAMTMMSGWRPGEMVSMAKYVPHRPKPD
jgi:hypothetical protein